MKILNEVKLPSTLNKVNESRYPMEVPLPYVEQAGYGFVDFGSVYGNNFEHNIHQIEKSYIMSARMISSQPDLGRGIMEIMNNLYDFDDPYEIQTDDNVLIAEFTQFKQFFTFMEDFNTNYKMALFRFFKQIYIDGQCCILKVVENNELKFIPIDVYRLNDYTTDDLKYKYEVKPNLFIEFTKDDLIRIDFGLIDYMGARHSYIEYARKYANQLQDMIDMLLQIRYKRSVSRRLFNVDLGEMPDSRATATLKEFQRKFKYDTVYNIKEGKIVGKSSERRNLVEDYWFSSKNGTKGTTVEVMDEGSTFDDKLEDIKFLNKKLFQSLFVPINRVFEEDAESDYTKTDRSNDEEVFYKHLQRVRSIYNSLLTEVFKSYLDFKKVEYSDFEITLKHSQDYENTKKQELLEKAIDLWESLEDHLGKVISYETAYTTCFRNSRLDAMEEFGRIELEKQDDNPFKRLAKSEDEDSEEW